MRPCLELSARRLAGAALLTLTMIASATAGEIEKLDNQGLEQAMAAGTVLIDIRRPSEWRETGLVPGSHRMTFFDKNGRYDAEAWVTGLNAVAGPDRPIALICHSGQRSSIVSRFLATRVGYHKVYDVTGGIVAWTKAGKPVETCSRDC